jgi:hypothetical protein
LRVGSRREEREAEDQGEQAVSGCGHGASDAFEAAIIWLGCLRLARER